MLSGSDDEDMARSLLKAGAMDYIRKPFQFDQLLQAILGCRGRNEASECHCSMLSKARGMGVFSAANIREVTLFPRDLHRLAP